MSNHHDEQERAVDKIIREAMARGDFDNLPGKGKPFPKDDNPFLSDDEWAVNRVMKNAGIAPAWIEERREIKAEISLARGALVRAWRWYQTERQHDWGQDEWERVQASFREAVAALNKRIRDHNLKAPDSSVHLAPLNADKEIALLQAEADGDG